MSISARQWPALKLEMNWIEERNDGYNNYKMKEMSYKWADDRKKEEYKYY